MPGRRTWTDDELRQAVRGVASLHGVFVELGLRVGGSQWLAVATRIAALGLDTSHWARPLHEGRPVGSRPAAWLLHELDLRALVRSGDSRADLLRRLGLEPDRTAYRHLARALAGQDLPDDVFAPRHEAMRRARRPRSRRRLDEVLVAGSTYSVGLLKQRLVAEGLLEPCCALCGIRQWRGRALSLHLDHVNGRRDDHRLHNLRLLCPNCHSQTDTYAGRNKGRPRPRS